MEAFLHSAGSQLILSHSRVRIFVIFSPRAVSSLSSSLVNSAARESRTFWTSASFKCGHLPGISGANTNDVPYFVPVDGESPEVIKCLASKLVAAECQIHDLTPHPRPHLYIHWQKFVTHSRFQ